MALVRTSDSDVLEVRRGGGWVGLLGLLFLAPGLGIIAWSLGLVPDGADAMPWYFGVPFGLAFAAAGAGVLLGRAGVILNRRDCTVTTWWGLLVPFRRTRRELAEFAQVVLNREVRRSKNSMYTVYPVRLGGPKPVLIEEPRDYARARRVAEEISAFLSRPLADSSSGTLIVRQPDELDESLRDHARRTGARWELPPQPAVIRSELQVEGARIVVRIPPPGVRPAVVIGVVLAGLVPLAIFAVFLMPLLAAGKLPAGPVLLVAAACLALIELPLLFFVMAGRTPMRVVVGPDGLSVERQGLLRGRRVHLPANEIEELILPRSATEGVAPVDAAALAGPAGMLLKSLSKTSQRGIQARSDTATAEFGQGLAPEELRWLHAVAGAVLSS